MGIPAGRAGKHAAYVATTASRGIGRRGYAKGHAEGVVSTATERRHASTSEASGNGHAS